MKIHTLLRPGIAILIVGTLVGCAPPATPDPTLQAKIEAFALTATARAGGADSAEATVQSVQAQATQHSQEVNATRTAQDQVIEADVHATQAAAAPLMAELPLYGIDVGAGHVGWIHDPVNMEIDGFRTGDFANDYPTLTVKDFVIAADITWDTQYGASGCGFALRSDGEQDAANQYLVIASRNANGHIYFTALANGKPANYRSFYANRLDPAFEWQNGSTNRIAVVAKGSLLSIYSNYTLIGEVDTTQPPPPVPDLPDAPKKPDPPELGGHIVKNKQDELQASYKAALEEYRQSLEEYKQIVTEIKNAHAAALKAYQTSDSVYDEGFVGMFAFAYSGYATCQFENAWLWVIDG